MGFWDRGSVVLRRMSVEKRRSRARGAEKQNYLLEVNVFKGCQGWDIFNWKVWIGGKVTGKGYGGY